MNRIIFDTETTGLLKAMGAPLRSQPKVIELYAVLVDKNWKPIAEFSELINPGEKLDPVIVKITSITDAMLKGKPSWSKVHDKAAAFFAKADQVIGHNLTFDMDMINNETRRIQILKSSTPDFPWPRLKMCTVEATEHLLGRRMKLGELHTHLLGSAFDGAHRAKADVMALHAVCKKLAENGEII